MSAGTPKVIVCAGGGGVGKTTASAALALALARAGHRTLVVTVDPARRLAQALGVDVDADVHAAHVEPQSEGRLFALMPEPRRSTRTFIEMLFEGRPEALQRMLDNRIYATLGDALAGIHELVSLMLVARAVEEADYDYLVIDTAPSRYALNFVSYPARLARLFEGRAVAWFGSLAQKATAQTEEAPKDERGLVAWGRKRVEAVLGRILDPRTMRDITSLFAELSLVRHRFASLARKSEHLLLGENTRYVLVASPSGAAEADLRYIVNRLDQLGQRAFTVLINRADETRPEWLRTLEQAQGITLPVTEALARLGRELDTRRAAADATEARLRSLVAATPMMRLPTVEARDPGRIVRALADALTPLLSVLAT